MNIHLDKIEEIFGAKFLRDEDFDHLICFDGVMYWRVMWDKKEQILHIAADHQMLMSSHPVLEIGVNECSDMSIHALTGGGTVLSFYRNGYSPGESDSAHTMITKRADGQISFAANIGKCSS